MKTIEQIKNEVAKEQGFSEWYELYFPLKSDTANKYINKVCKRCADQEVKAFKEKLKDEITELASMAWPEVRTHVKILSLIDEPAVLTQEPEQEEENFDPFLVCGPPERKKRKKSLEKQGTEIIEQWGKSKVDNSAHGHTEGADVNPFGEFVAPAPVDNQEELWREMLDWIRAWPDISHNEVIFHFKSKFKIERI